MSPFNEQQKRHKYQSVQIILWQIYKICNVEHFTREMQNEWELPLIRIEFEIENREENLKNGWGFDNLFG